MQKVRQTARAEALQTAMTFAVALFCTVLSVWYTIPLMGRWEASAIFHTLAPEQLSLDWRIQPRAAIGGYCYAVLDMARHLIETAGVSLINMRIVPLAYGLGALLLLFILVRRWFDYAAAIAAVLLLATNEMFQVFTHQYIILMPSVFFLLLVLERFQKWYFPAGANFATALSFGFACSLSALHYGPGRYYMLMIMLYWICSSAPKERRHLLRLQAVGVGSFFLALIIFNWRNLYYFLNLKFFLSPPGSDNAQNFADAVQSLPANLPLVLAGFTHVKSAYNSGLFSEHSTDLLTDIRYTVTSPVLRVFLVAGLLYLVRHLTNHLKVFLLGLFAITVLSPAFSNVTILPNITIPTYNCFRVFFSAVPITIISGVGYSALLAWARRKNIVLTYCAAIASIVAIFMLTTNLQREKDRFYSYVQNYPCAMRKAGEQAGAYICGDVPGFTLTWENTFKAMAERKIHVVYNEHIPYYRFARMLESEVTHISLANQEVALLHIPVWPLPPNQREHYQTYNYHQLFLSLYLGDQRQQVGYIPFYTDRPQHQERPSLRSLKGIKAALATSLDDGSRKLPARLDTDRKHYVVNPGETLVGTVRNFHPGQTKYLLVTTPEERDFAMAYLKNHQLRGRFFKMDNTTGKLTAEQ